MFAKKAQNGGDRSKNVRCVIGSAARKKLKSSMISLAFTLIFAALLVRASALENGDEEHSAGVFKSQNTLYAICYDCSDDDTAAIIESDLEAMSDQGCGPMLPSEINENDSAGVLILLENMDACNKGVEALLENGMKAVMLIEPEVYGRAGGLNAELLSKETIEVSVKLEEYGCGTGADIYAAICDTRLELMSRFGIDAKSFTIGRSFDSSEHFDFRGFEEEITVFAEGSGVNTICGYSDCMSFISFRRRTEFAHINEFPFN